MRHFLAASMVFIFLMWSAIPTSMAAGPSKKYRLVILGFEVHAQTWDDALQHDGQNDEVFISTAYKYLNKDGKSIGLPDIENRTQIIGDPNGWPGRIPWIVDEGGGSRHFGLKTGDVFPTPNPWLPSIQPSPARNYPPFVVWEGKLEKGENVVFVTPTLWEWDEGASALDGWLQWIKQTDDKFGDKAKEIFAGRFQGIGWIFDAVHLGIQTTATLTDCITGPLGCPATRPIGMTKDPQANTYSFNPKGVVLTYELAEQLVQGNPEGRGNGIFSIPYTDDPKLRGDYLLWFKVEVAGEPKIAFVGEHQEPLERIELPTQGVSADYNFVIRVQNRAPNPLAVTNVYFDGGPFTLAPGGFWTSLNPGGVFGFEAKFHPQAEGTFESNFVIQSGDTDFPEVRIPVKATAQGTASSGVLNIAVDGLPLHWGRMGMTVRAVDSSSQAPIAGKVLIALPDTQPFEAGVTNAPFSFDLNRPQAGGGRIVPPTGPVVSPAPGGGPTLPGAHVLANPKAIIDGVPAPYKKAEVDLGPLPPN